MTVQKAPARPYHHGDLRRALADAATELAAVGGAENVTLREVARRVGVSASAAYRHFPNREGLLAQVASEAREALARRMVAAVAAVGAGSDGAPVDRFRATGRAYIEFALDEPGLFEVAFRACPPDLYVPDDPSPYALLSEALDTLDHAGLLAVKRPGAETAAWVAVHGAAVLLGDGMLPPSDRDTIIDATLDMVGGGLLVATAHA
ncbi:MAG TPA: TetR/AcrR family transcriptional regulator [Candidatus Limnocylindrales bacterium]|nr:TetR/AcrR family transcriptional regulator [Candidatus Limnocylindrales bacterium]